MKLYNTLTKKVEEFVPYNEKEVTLYTCGPTVYHFAHIGNLRTYIFEDILEKTLKYVGYNVKRCMNITDVGHLTSDSDTGDDKMMVASKREHKSVLEIAEYYTECFKEDCKKLNIEWPKIVSKATDNIPMYFKIITKLLNDGYAYISGGNVYFDTSKLDDYYLLTNHKIDDMVVGVREGVEEDLSKKNQADFVLWFTKSKFDDQELKWESPWGYGYPGWHIECSGISIKNLGEYLDIHCGGVDNIFPHHTNEIAQSESFLGHKWCKFWVHGEHLNDDTGKMSKSKGEFLTVSLLEAKGYEPIFYRFMCLNTSYRKVLVFTYDALDQAKNTYQKLKNKIKTINSNLEGKLDTDVFNKYKEKFIDAIGNDLNMPQAISVLYDVLKDEMSNITKIELIKDFDKVLSLDLLDEKEVEIDKELLCYINKKIEERKIAKENKDYTLADNIRSELLDRGIELIDSREGTTFKIV